MSKLKFSKYSVKKSEKMDLKRATERAMKAMETTEPNIVVTEDETHYRFKKVRE
jgi:hypothetical protein